MAREESAPIDWERVHDEATLHLQRLIRCDTTNPPGNETPAAEYLRDVLAAEGIECAVYESAPGRGNLYARLKGTGEKRPLMLLSHLDVVPAETANWQVPPFEGVIKDGCIWGRGAVDMKSMTAMELMVVLLLNRQRVRPARDIILLATADEEIGGRMGIVWMLQNHPELVDCEYALNESGGQGINYGDRRLYLCQVAEKGGTGMKLRAKGSPGHASVPKDNNALIKLAQGLAKIRPRAMPVHLTKTVCAFVEEVAEGYHGRDRDVILSLLDPDRTNEALSSLPDPGQADIFSAVLRNTATPTILKGGEKNNVIPSEAEVTLDCRALPGYGSDDVQRELQALLSGEEVEVEPVGRGGYVPLSYELGTDNELFDAIGAVVRDTDPGSRVVPYMLSGATDSRFLVRRGTIAYGFGPIMYPQPGGSTFHAMAHAHDERIPLENMAYGTRMLYDIVRRVCMVG